jgi:rhodanese-related sulfurtransferase
MSNVYGAPEISVQEVAARRARGESFVLMDVREEMELRLANLGQKVTHVPLSQLAAIRLEALPKTLQDRAVEIVVFCHTGMRSAQVTAWLLSQGWSNVASMAGGIEAYATQVDPKVGRY